MKEAKRAGLTKGEKSRRNIVAKAAVVFNQRGFEGCSMQDIVEALQLAPDPVSLFAPVGEDELRTYCSERLARFKVPKSFHVLDELPRNSLGKVVKSELRQAVAV